jgi:LPXTG-motif cell wall-anchored protein
MLTIRADLAVTGTESVGILIVVLGLVALGLALLFLGLSRRSRRRMDRR